MKKKQKIQHLLSSLWQKFVVQFIYTVIHWLEGVQICASFLEQLFHSEGQVLQHLNDAILDDLLAVPFKTQYNLLRSLL